MSSANAGGVQSARVPRGGGPTLALKVQPAQERAARTFELLLDVAARTLADVGIDRFSTNLVCQRAGLSPPALYRYFPNKYALLAELARRLMQRQNAVIPLWITPEVLAGPASGLQKALEGLLLDTYRVTRATTAGTWITRALRAVPALSEVRLESHAEVTQMQAELARRVHPDSDVAQLRLASRVTVELVYAAVEMLFDEPDIDPQAVAGMVSAMLAGFMGQLPVRARASTRVRALSQAPGAGRRAAAKPGAGMPGTTKLGTAKPGTAKPGAAKTAVRARKS